LNDSASDLSSRRLGDYQLLRRLGRGGMADVYLAEQLSLQRPVAFKVLKAHLAQDETYVRRFHNEAQAAAKLVHSSIVQIYEVGCVEGFHYIAQEYVPGQNLKQVLTRRGKGLDAALAVNVLRQVASALQKAAEQNIIHRDIKPENIMLSNSGDVKVADFGLARVAREGASTDLTQVGITMGTPLYMSPEQVEGQPTDPRSDLYSLGVTAYHMLAGRPPFEGETALSIAVQHLRTEPGRLEAKRPDLPEGLCRIIHKLLSKNKKDRYQQPVELLRELRALRIEGLEDSWPSDLLVTDTGDVISTSAARMAATQQLGRIMQSQPKRKKWRVGTAIVLLALLGLPVGAAVAWVTRPDPVLTYSPADLPQVKRMETVDSQWFYATMATTNNEQAWRAVWEYFPPEKDLTNLRYSRLAKKGLAAYYLENRQYESALELYQELANLEETEGQFRVQGLAGEAIVFDRLSRPSEAQERLARVLPRREQLDEFLRGEVDQLAKKYNVNGSGG
jgi:eukaryotic-like serine/threonine-protein kinase